MSKQLSVLTVIGKDRPGIIAKVTEALYRSRCNLEDMSMTVLDRELAMMIVVCMDPRKAAGIEKKFETLGRKSSLSFFWKKLKPQGRVREKRKTTGMTCLVTAIGKDRTGIVYELSRVMAGFGLNITDLNSRVLGSGAQSLYALMLEADVPQGFSLKKLSSRLQAAAKKMKIEIQVKPVERLEC